MTSTITSCRGFHGGKELPRQRHLSRALRIRLPANRLNQWILAFAGMTEEGDALYGQYLA